MKKDSLLQHIQTRLTALQQCEKELQENRTRLYQQCTAANEGKLWPKISKISMRLWECRGMQRAYQELHDALSQKSPPIIAQISQPSQTPSTVCPQCSNILTITTDLDPAPQPGYITITTQYECPQCGYHENDRVNLPKEIALQRYNLENLMKGV